MHGTQLSGYCLKAPCTHRSCPSRRLHLLLPLPPAPCRGRTPACSRSARRRAAGTRPGRTAHRQRRRTGEVHRPPWRMDLRTYERQG